MTTKQKNTGLEVAVIGISCRFPGAANWRQFWANMVNGTESIEILTDEQLAQAGVKPETINQAGFVRARAVIKDKDSFDYAFFDYSQSEAMLMNPVHRIFHECVWEALEDAGYNPDEVDGPIGVYAGAGDDLNWKAYSLLNNAKQDVDDFTLGLINSKDNIATMLSYKLNLKGSSYTIETGCSTSLTAINMAYKSLLLGEGKLAIAGGLKIGTKKQDGYVYDDKLIWSADGHSRAFDAAAGGTVNSEGAGVVILKRLNDAIKDRDHIYAIIKGSAINNDGNRKVGFEAPSVEGQMECVKKALVFAKVDPASIGLMEAHGTATRLGDPIEVEALNTAFNNNKEKHCAINSVKSNIGHTDAAAGVASFIKAALCLQNKKLTPTINFTEPNPEIDFDGGPFYVNTTLKDWNRKNDEPLRAGISSFAVGGTNAHAILEEAPAQEAGDPARTNLLLVMSAKNENALQRYAAKLKDFVQANAELDLADMAYTLQTGRKHFARRHWAVFSNREELLAALDNPKIKEVAVKSKDRSNNVVFMFSGQGSQYANMARDLYECDKLFKEELDKGLDALQTLTGTDFRTILFTENAADSPVNETRYTQPLLFAVEYALAKVLMASGITPKYMIGHSIGEYVAACLAGVFSLEDAIKLVSKRGELMFGVAPGSMLSVPMIVEDALQYLTDGISLAAVNGPQQLVFSGEDAAIEKLKAALDAKEVPHITLHTSHAFHSSMQDGILEAFKAFAATIAYNKPELPFISNLTGELIKDEEAMSAEYWTKHLRNTVRFSAGLKTLLAKSGDAVFVEVGPGQALTSLLKQQPTKTPPIGINLIRPIKEQVDDLRYFTNKLGQLWAYGVAIKWKNYYGEEKRRKVALPTYSFEPTKCPTVVATFDRKLFLDGATTTAPVQPAAVATPEAATVAAVDPGTLPPGAMLDEQGNVVMPPPMDAAMAAALGIELGPDGYPTKELTEEQLMAIAEYQVSGDVVSYEMRQDRPDLSTEFVEASSDTEKKLKEMFEGFFGYKEVGIDDNFFELGGDSLKGMVVLKKIKTEFDINISLKDFFGKQTIREIAAEVDEIKMLLQKTTSSSKKSIKI
jgi:phthiocerol/phenolphthiocerol synthesis type-I polyketide synthase E